jgi:hypothetical protein
MKGTGMGGALFGRLGDGDSVRPDILPEESPICDLVTQLVEGKEVAQVKGRAGRRVQSGCEAAV